MKPLPSPQVRIYRRGRTPIYPYYYNPGRPGGYSFFFGFVPYAKGDIENQAHPAGAISAEYRVASGRERRASSGLGAQRPGIDAVKPRAQRRLREEFPEQACGLRLSPKPPIDLRRMMAGGLREKARAMLHRAAFGIGRAEIKPADAGEGDGRGAHGARLERHIEIAVDQPLAAELRAGRADGKQLGMRRRVAQGRACGCRRLPAPRRRRSPPRRRSAPRRGRARGSPRRERDPSAARPCQSRRHLQACAPWAAKWGPERAGVKSRGRARPSRKR